MGKASGSISVTYDTYVAQDSIVVRDPSGIILTTNGPVGQAGTLRGTHSAATVSLTVVSATETVAWDLTVNCS